MTIMRCENPVRSCGEVEHLAKLYSYYWVCSVCGCPAERLYKENRWR